MAMEKAEIHFILFPLMAPGHMIPMIDIAKLLALQNVVVSVITTPLNAKRFAPTLARSGLHIQLLQLPFPTAEAGLPPGCENLDTLPSLDLVTNFFIALSLLQKDVRRLMEDISPRPTCIISDMGLPWTTQIAHELDIPRIVFHGTCCFSLLCSHIIRSSGILETLKSDSDYFEVPDIPDRILIRKSWVTSFASKKSETLKDVTEQIRAAEKTSYGVVVNSFEELEKPYMEAYSKAKGEKVWCIGPVSLCNNDKIDLADRGNKCLVDEDACSRWLDSREDNSVIYASLGSLVRLTAAQMDELALGLEATNRPFIWALGGGEFVDNGYEERVKERGLVIRGWAPQLLILAHRATGCFLTHCGWNSTLEGICAGVPLVTWPFFADQFFNERLVVQVLGIGVRIGVEEEVKWGEEDKVGVVVKKEDVKKALDLAMEEEEEASERRRKAKEFGLMAKRATEAGGSSALNVKNLVQQITTKFN